MEGGLGYIRRGSAVRVRYDTVHGQKEYDTVVEDVVTLGTGAREHLCVLVRTEGGKVVGVPEGFVIKVYS